ncbi:hypothetical protein M1D72_21525 [Vibrio sp. AK197]|uniref:Uncharacterized protein n=1 Tax=Vibrio olivae TaxID=1243002 RepID=A0ABV5HT32_9VIBR
MRPTSVRFSNTNRSAMRRRSGFAASPVANKSATHATLAEQKAIEAATPKKVVQAA